MSENLKLGQVITTPQERDAIHIAVVPVVAAVSMQPGTRCGIDPTGKAAPCIAEAAYVGVVDPYLRGAVPTGASFWLFLEPGSITSLRHDWTHPAFPSAQPAGDAKAYLEDVARTYGTDMETMLSAIKEGHYCLSDDIDEHRALDAAFWACYTAYTGRAKPSDAADYFRCAC